MASLPTVLELARTMGVVLASCISGLLVERTFRGRRGWIFMERTVRSSEREDEDEVKGSARPTALTVASATWVLFTRQAPNVSGPGLSWALHLIWHLGRFLPLSLLSPVPLLHRRLKCGMRIVYSSWDTSSWMRRWHVACVSV